MIVDKINMTRQVALPGMKLTTEFGGTVAKGKRKVRRSVATKSPMHVVLKSEKARGKFSLLNRKNAVWLRSFLPEKARQYGVQLLEWSNAGNHLHLVVRAKSRHSFQTFFRVVAGLIARKVTLAQKGRAFGSFWTERMYSRIVSWGRELSSVFRYVRKNGVFECRVLGSLILQPDLPKICPSS